MPVILPFPLTVIEVTDPDEAVAEEEARATSSSVGDGRAQAVEAAARAAMAEKVFMVMLLSWRSGVVERVQDEKLGSITREIVSRE